VIFIYSAWRYVSKVGNRCLKYSIYRTYNLNTLKWNQSDTRCYYSTAKKVDHFLSRFTSKISHSNGMEILQGFAWIRLSRNCKANCQSLFWHNSFVGGWNWKPGMICVRTMLHLGYLGFGYFLHFFEDLLYPTILSKSNKCYSSYVKQNFGNPPRWSNLFNNQAPFSTN